MGADQRRSSRTHNDEAAVQLLVRTLLRVCVASGGLSPTLDPYLDTLRRLLRSGYKPAAQPHLQELCDQFLNLAELDRTPTLLIRLLSHCGGNEHDVAKAAALWSQLAGDPAAAADEDLDRLARLLRLPRAPVLDTELSETGGLLGKLWSRTAQGGRSNRTLATLLRRLTWPPPLEAEIEAYTERLERSESDEAWLEVVEELSRQVVDNLEQARSEVERTGHFLAELTDRLESLDRNMDKETQRRAEADASGERLGRSVRDEVGGIADQVRAGGDLKQLRRSVLQRLDRIHSHVDRHLSEESARRRAAEEESARIQATVVDLEREAFDLRRQLVESSERALSDALTGLPNRAAYEERVVQEFARWRRFGEEPLILLLWDVDNFKQVNDRYGHKAGDKALRLIADVLRRRLRVSDFIARYGGEEFAVLMIGATPEGALTAAEQMRAAVENAPLHARQKRVAVTLSGGLTPFVPGDTLERVFERADQALYRAKREGKNRCVLASG